MVPVGCASHYAIKATALGVSGYAPRRRGLHALQPKALTPRTTDSTHELRCAPNRLLNQPKPTRANRVWVSDITYLPLANGDWA